MSTYNTCNPYLFFNGDAAEAISFYQEVFAAKVEMTTYGESPMEVAEEHKNKIMHAWLSFDKINIMISDTMPGQEVKRGSDFAINLNMITEDLGQRIYDRLAKGGRVVMPYEKTFWGATFGVLYDKFGIQWMVNFADKK